MFCTNCGKQLSDGDAFCGWCGTPVEDNSVQNPTGMVNPYDYTQSGKRTALERGDQHPVSILETFAKWIPIVVICMGILSALLSYIHFLSEGGYVAQMRFEEREGHFPFTAAPLIEMNTDILAILSWLLVACEIGLMIALRYGASNDVNRNEKIKKHTVVAVIVSRLLLPMIVVILENIAPILFVILLLITIAPLFVKPVIILLILVGIFFVLRKLWGGLNKYLDQKLRVIEERERRERREWIHEQYLKWNKNRVFEVKRETSDYEMCVFLPKGYEVYEDPLNEDCICAYSAEVKMLYHFWYGYDLHLGYFIDADEHEIKTSDFVFVSKEEQERRLDLVYELDRQAYGYDLQNNQREQEEEPLNESKKESKKKEKHTFWREVMAETKAMRERNAEIPMEPKKDEQPQETEKERKLRNWDKSTIIQIGDDWYIPNNYHLYIEKAGYEDGTLSTVHDDRIRGYVSKWDPTRTFCTVPALEKGYVHIYRANGKEVKLWDITEMDYEWK